MVSLRSSVVVSLSETPSVFKPTPCDGDSESSLFKSLGAKDSTPCLCGFCAHHSTENTVSKYDSRHCQTLSAWASACSGRSRF